MKFDPLRLADMSSATLLEKVEEFAEHLFTIDELQFLEDTRGEEVLSDEDHQKLADIYTRLAP